MKNIINILFFSIAIIGCSKEMGADQGCMPGEYPQKWQLVKMRGNMPNSESTGPNMEWQEFYILKPDQTFTKFRSRNNVSEEASGTFTFKTITNENYLQLVYAQSSDLIGNCTQDDVELLVITADNILSSTWPMCDGPGLEYVCVKLDSQTD